MPSIATSLSICNQAMSWLGANLITSFDDDTNEARYCKANYNLLRDAVLEEYYWTFATRRIRLGAPIPPEENSPYPENRYPVPADTIRLWLVADDVNFTPTDTTVWRLENNHIVTESKPIFVKYTYRLIDTAQMSTAFTQAVAARVAVDLCLPITESNRKLAAMQELYVAKLDLAKTTDGMQGRNDRVRSTWMRRSRTRTSSSSAG